MRATCLTDERQYPGQPLPLDRHITDLQDYRLPSVWSLHADQSSKLRSSGESDAVNSD